MKKSERYAWIGTIISTVVVILIMLFVVLPGLKKPEEGGIMISFGNADDGAGFEQTAGVQAESKPVAPVIKKEELITQKDKSVVMPETEKKKNDKTTKTTNTTKNTDDQKKKDQQVATQKANDLIGGSFGSSNSTGSGNTNSSSSQGNPVGKGTSGGNSWDLSGRNLSGSMPAPGYDQNEEGFITVQIRVDASGNVVSATIIRGDITSASLRNSAVSAALKTKFTTGTGIVTGTITYNFKLK